MPTGRAIQRAAAEGGIKHVTLELGGKNPLIAFPDMDPDKVAKIAVAGMNFAWQGQSCGSTSRLLLHESLYKPVLERVVERVAALRLGDPLDDKSQMGPINSKRHYERVVSMVESGKSDGAKLMTGGKRPPGSDFARGYWLEPTVFADVNPGMRIAKEEIFGPGALGVPAGRTRRKRSRSPTRPNTASPHRSSPTISRPRSAPRAR